MSFRRVGGCAAVALAILLWAACGQVYRPVVIPCSVGGVPGCPVETPPTPSNFHAVFALGVNAPNYPGGAMQIDVSGDSIIAETPTSDLSAPNLGDNPTHAAILSNDARIFVASAGSIYPGKSDAVSFFVPVFQTSSGAGFSTVGSINLPTQTTNISSISESGSLVTATLSAPLNVVAGYAIVIAGVTITGCSSPCNTFAYDGTFALSSVSGSTIQYMNTSATGLATGSGGTASVPPQPVFLNSAESTAMYVANYNSNSVFAIDVTSGVVVNSATVGAHPVSLAETSKPLTGNTLKLYVANEGSNSVSSLNTVDLSSNTVTGFSGINPIWVVARGDSQRVYVLTQGDGQLVTIDTGTDSVVGSSPVGAGANFMSYDSHLNRLYVTNPVTSTVYVFSDTGGNNDTPTQLAAISLASGFSACPAGAAGCSAVWPVSVTALADGSRFYVAAYQTATSCPDALVGTPSACVIPGLTVFNANNFQPEYSTASTLELLTDPPFQTNLPATQPQYAVPLVSSCGPVTPPTASALYSPASTRFRVFTTASVDGSHVYVSICDAGVIADINTSGANTNNPGNGTSADAVITDLPAPFAICTQASCQSTVSITGFSITSNVITFQAANAFTPGQTVSISGLTTGTYLNGLTLTVLATGLSSSQFECYFASADVAQTTDSGTAVPLPPSQTPIFLFTGQ
jgi:YVTN family beta-propeller protein